MRQILQNFKTACLLCALAPSDEFGLCVGCLHDLPWHKGAHCKRCARLSPTPLCGACLRMPPAFDATHALFCYEFPLNALLVRYKYSGALHLAKLFATLMAAHHQAHSTIDALIPMPMHPQRLKERGFNQALEIARDLAVHKGLPLRKTTCERVKHTPPQTSLKLKARLANVRGAFACTEPVTALRIALIDDIMTSGASLNALAATLKQAGALHVECWVVARTLL